MANVTTELKVVVKAVGKNDLKQLQVALTNLGTKAAEPAKVNFKELAVELKKVQTTSKNSISNLRAYSSAWKDIANNVEIGTKEFKEATAEAAKLDRQLQKTSQRRGGGLRSAAQSVGAIAAGGVFGGPEGALGAGIGAIAGGPAGAAVGAAIGAQVGALRQAAGASAEYAANITKLRIALQGVTTSQKEYQQSLDFIQQTTKDFAVPQEVVTRQFTKLQASVQGAGGNLEDTKTAFNGIVAAVRATGGSLSDVDAALTATAQVFSKGKVSAEELRQQIGERLPGAFTLFAESMGKTPQELDKALEDGKVSLQDFQRFAEAIFERYGENAKTIAAGPASAGDRLKFTLEQLNETIGNLLAPIGAQFQETFNGIAKAILNAVNALDRFFGISKEQRTNSLITQVNAINATLVKTRLSIKGTEEEIAKGGDLFGTRTGKIEEDRRFIAELENKREKLRAQINELTRGQAVTVEQPTAGGGLPGIIDDPKSETSKARQEAADRIKTTSQELLDLAIARNEALSTGNLIRAAELNFALKIQKLTEQFNAGEIDFNTAQIKSLDAQNQLIKAGLRLRQQEKKDLADLNKGQQDVNKELTDNEKLFQAVGKTLGNTLLSAFDNLIEKTKEWGDILRDVLRQLGMMLVKAGLNAFAGDDKQGVLNFLGFGGGMANGGPVNASTAYLVGERGPELFVPFQNGEIVTNDETQQMMNAAFTRGSNNSVSNQYGGSSSTAVNNSYQQMQLASVPFTRTAEQASIVAAERETAQAISNPAPLDVRFESQSINGVEYVTAEQHQKGMAQAADRGRALTLQALQNSVKSRRKIGL